MPDFRFDPEKHEYWLGEDRLMGVSEVLESAGIKPKNEFRNGAISQALTIGSYVHTACQMLDEGELDLLSLDPVIEPYVRAWMAFQAEIPFEWEHIEVPMYNTDFGVFGIAGTPDRCGRPMAYNLQRTIVDIKTGDYEKWHQIQTALYALLWPCTARMSVYLRADGTHEKKDRKSTRLNSSHIQKSRMPSSA